MRGGGKGSVERARSAGVCQCRAVLLSDGFDEAWFNDGQKVLELPPQDPDDA